MLSTTTVPSVFPFTPTRLAIPMLARNSEVRVYWYSLIARAGLRRVGESVLVCIGGVSMGGLFNLGRCPGGRDGWGALICLFNKIL